MSKLKKTYCLVFFCCISSILQAKVLTINLQNKLLNFSTTYFYIEDVIDSRVDKTNIGIARTGVFNIKSQVKLEGGFTDVIKNILTNTFPYSDSKIPIIIDIHDFKISEQYYFGLETAEADVNIDFLTKIDNKLVIIYSDQTSIQKPSNLDCTKFHEGNIIEVFQESLQKFINLGNSLDEVINNNIKLSQIENESKQNDYFNNWEKSNEFSIKYNYTWKGILFEYQKEKILSNNDKSANSYSYNIGYYKISNDNVDLIVNERSHETGHLELDSISYSFFLNKIIKNGFFMGDWSVGLMNYAYFGNVYLTDPYYYGRKIDGFGLGADIVLEGSFNVVNLGGNSFLKIITAVHIPIVNVAIQKKYGEYLNITPYSGGYIGLSYNKYF